MEERRELVCAMRRRQSAVQEICGRFGVSRAFAYRLSERCATEGWSGLEPRRRGPKRWGGQRGARYRKWILAARQRHPHWSGWKLWHLLRRAYPRVVLPSVRTVERWLRQAGLTRRRPPRVRLRPKPLRPARLARRPNDRWTFDWKGWRRTADRRKVEPFTVRDEATKQLLWVLPLSDHRDGTLRRKCCQLFRRYGVPKVIRTDRGGPFCGNGPHGLTSLSAWWLDLGIGVEFVSRRGLLHNNAHEQMHAVMEQEVFQPTSATYQAQLRRLRQWQREFNELRPHARLGGRTPAQCYRPRPAALPKPPPVAYPRHWPVRRVAASGTIGLGGAIHYISRAFAGRLVGCQPHGRSFRVHYRRLLLHVVTPQLKLPT